VASALRLAASAFRRAAVSRREHARACRRASRRASCAVTSA